MVDVRDVVLAHVLAYEHRSVGRHLCIGACPHWTEVHELSDGGGSQTQTVGDRAAHRRQ